MSFSFIFVVLLGLILGCEVYFLFSFSFFPIQFEGQLCVHTWFTKIFIKSVCMFVCWSFHTHTPARQSSILADKAQANSSLPKLKCSKLSTTLLAVGFTSV